MLDMAKSIGESLAIVIVAVASAIQYMKIQNKKEDVQNKTKVSRSVEYVAKYEADIVKNLEYIKEETFADRVMLFEFHNGVHYADGRIATKTSCTFEVCRHSQQQLQAEYQNIQLSRVVKSLKRLFDEEIIRYRDNLKQLEEDDYETYKLFEKSGVKRLYARLIRNNIGNPIGFIVVEYCTEETNNIEFDEMKFTEHFGVIKEKLYELVEGFK